MRIQPPRPRPIETPAARNLFLRHVKQLDVQHQAAVAGTPQIDKAPGQLNAGEEELYSFWVPGLEAGNHSINVVQAVHTPAVDDIPAHDATLHTEQTFEVAAPRFSLPDGDVHSTYPPQGHGDEPRILPHIVFQDPHLPWERDASSTDNKNDPEWTRNRVPWLALLSFSIGDDGINAGLNELTLSPDLLSGPNTIFPATMTQPVTQSATYSVNMSMNDLWSMAPTVVTPIYAKESNEPVDGSTTADIVFVPADLFTTFFSKYDLSGAVVPGQTSPDVSRYKYLAHVRNVHTAGMADSGVSEDGLFSIVVGHRAGPITITKPTTVVVHLVSIENIEAGIKFPLNAAGIPPKTTHVGLASLYSWSYQCLPPLSISLSDRLENLGSTLNYLRAPDPSATIKTPTPIQQRVIDRLKDGYSLTHYRTSTGDNAVALNRGPFTPTRVSNPLATFTGAMDKSSMFGTDLQILDNEIGIMNITYSTAWQLGKTMAIGDRVFASALMRIRSTIHALALNAAKKELLSSSFKGKKSVAGSLNSSVRSLHLLNDGTKSADLSNRWNRSLPEGADLSLANPEMRRLFENHVEHQTLTIASAVKETQTPEDEDVKLYNELNVPKSPDWAIVLKWILDKTHLVNIPAHYLIPDPTFLPKESLKFFFVDPNWLHCFIDGALSIANHIEQDVDTIRSSIKRIIKKYLEDEYPDLGIAPSVPIFGFLLNSVVVTQYPDLVVTAPLPAGSKKAQLVRQENISKDVLLVLLDREPSSPDFESLLLSQPPHQQYFAIGSTLDDTELELRYPRVYAPIELSDPDRSEEIWQLVHTKPSPIFDWSTRCMTFPNFAQDVLDNISIHMEAFKSGSFTDKTRSSALVAIQLNEKMYQLQINVKKNPLVATGATASTSTPVSGPPAKTAKVTKPAISSVKPENPVSEKQTQAVSNLPLPSPTNRAQRSVIKVATTKAPNSKALRVPLVPPPSVKAGVGPAQRQFSLSCYPLTNFKAALPTQEGLPIDVVFSIQRRVDFTPGLELNCIIINIPIGTVQPPTPKEVVNLMDTEYNGEGVTMLSNLRFNAWMATSKDSHFMNVKLIPRTTKAFVDIAANKEISFIMNGVNINPYTANKVLVIQGQEVWMQRPTTPFSDKIQMSPVPSKAPGAV